MKKLKFALTISWEDQKQEIDISEYGFDKEEDFIKFIGSLNEDLTCGNVWLDFTTALRTKLDGRESINIKF